MKRPDFKAAVKGAGLAVLAGALSVYVLVALGPKGNIIAALSRMSLGFALAALAAAFALWCVQALRIQLIMKAYGKPLGLRHATTAYLASSFVAHVTPFSAGGAPAMAYFVYKRGIPLVQATSGVMVQTALTLVILLALSPVLLFIYRDRPEFGGSGVYVAFATVLALIAFACYLLSKPRTLRKVLYAVLLTGPAGWAVRRVRADEKAMSVVEGAAAWVSELLENVEYIWRRAKATFIWSCLLAVLFWVLYVLPAPLILLGLGVHISPASAAAPQLAFSMLQAFIPTPGGSGGAELGFAAMYREVVPGASLASFVLAWRFLTYYLRLAAGGVALIAALRWNSDGSDRHEDRLLPR